MKGTAITHGETVSGMHQNTIVMTIVPSIQKTHVRCARLPNSRSVAHPAITMPRFPPINSNAATMIPATATDIPLVWGRSIIPQSSNENRTM